MNRIAYIRFRQTGGHNSHVGLYAYSWQPHCCLATAQTHITDQLYTHVNHAQAICASFDQSLNTTVYHHRLSSRLVSERQLSPVSVMTPIANSSLVGLLPATLHSTPFNYLIVHQLLETEILLWEYCIVMLFSLYWQLYFLSSYSSCNSVLSVSLLKLSLNKMKWNDFHYGRPTCRPTPWLCQYRLWWEVDKLTSMWTDLRHSIPFHSHSLLVICNLA